VLLRLGLCNNATYAVIVGPHYQNSVDTRGGGGGGRGGGEGEGEGEGGGGGEREREIERREANLHV
jgi:hypothetical protein